MGTRLTAHLFHTVAAVVYIFFCFEVGLFLLIFPWIHLWEQNFFSSFGANWYHFWINPYFRGAISGLGLFDMIIALSALFNLRRAARRRSGPSRAEQGAASIQ